MSNVLSTKKMLKIVVPDAEGLEALEPWVVWGAYWQTQREDADHCVNPRPPTVPHPLSPSPWSVGWSPLVPWNRRVCDPSVPSVDLGGTCVQLTEGPLPENTNLNSVLAENSNTRKEKRQKMLCCVNRIASQINAAQDFLKSLADEW